MENVFRVIENNINEFEKHTPNPSQEGDLQRKTDDNPGLCNFWQRSIKNSITLDFFRSFLVNAKKDNYNKEQQIATVFSKLRNDVENIF